MDGTSCFQRGTSVSIRARNTAGVVSIMVIPMTAAFSFVPGCSRAAGSSA